MQNRSKKVQVWIYRWLESVSENAPESVEVLILKTQPERGGFWQPVTGGVEEGESFSQAALREASEESGLTFNSGPLDLDSELNYINRWEVEVTEQAFALEVSSESSGAVKLDSVEHCEFRWLKPPDAVSLIQYESNKNILKIFLDKIFDRSR